MPYAQSCTGIIIALQAYFLALIACYLPSRHRWIELFLVQVTNNLSSPHCSLPPGLVSLHSPCLLATHYNFIHDLVILASIHGFGVLCLIIPVCEGLQGWQVWSGQTIDVRPSMLLNVWKLEEKKTCPCNICFLSVVDTHPWLIQD